MWRFVYLPLLVEHLTTLPGEWIFVLFPFSFQMEFKEIRKLDQELATAGRGEPFGNLAGLEPLF